MIEDIYSGYNAPGSVEQPVNANEGLDTTVDPAYLEELSKELKTARLGKGQNQVLPPDYYYPDNREGIVKGNLSTPMGNFPLMSAGLPLFPYNILDAARQEMASVQAKKIAEENKPFNYGDWKTINPQWTQGWTEYAYNDMSSFWNDAVSKYGSRALARQEVSRDGSFQKKMAELKNQQYVLDKSYTEAQAVLDMASDPAKDIYVSKETKRTAEELKNRSWNFYDKETISSVLDLTKAFHTAIGIDTAYKHFYEKAKNVKFDTGFVLNPEMSTWVQKVYSSDKVTGLEAMEMLYKLSDEDNPNTQIFLSVVEQIKSIYDNTYDEKNAYDPTFQDVLKQVLSNTPTGKEVENFKVEAYKYSGTDGKTPTPKKGINYNDKVNIRRGNNLYAANQFEKGIDLEAGSVTGSIIIDEETGVVKKVSGIPKSVAKEVVATKDGLYVRCVSDKHIYDEEDPNKVSIYAGKMYSVPYLEVKAQMDAEGYVPSDRLKPYANLSSLMKVGETIYTDKNRTGVK